jgi:predicted nucleic acid-binding protein
MLREFCQVSRHEFWSDEVSFLDLLETDASMSPGQITDAYLLGLAVHNSGKLATLDSRIPAHAVRGGSQALEVIVQ